MHKESRLFLPIDTACTLRFILLRKKVQKGIARLLTPDKSISVMPNQPSATKGMIGLRIPRPLLHRVRKAAKLHKMSVTDWLVWVLTKETQNIELSPDDYRQIAEEIQALNSGVRVDHRLRDAGGKGKAGNAGAK